MTRHPLGPAKVAPPPPTTPRALEFLRAKRNLPLTWRSYGHWWLEVDEDESYGWWPTGSVGLVSTIRGTTGVLNGLGSTSGGTGTRDPNHGLPADYDFAPHLTVRRSDDEVRQLIRGFAADFSGQWKWSTRPTMNCRLFQLALFDSIGLVDGTGNYLTRGAGCPALAPVRRSLHKVTGRRRWPRNLPPPGRRVAEVLQPARTIPPNPTTPTRRQSLRLRSS